MPQNFLSCDREQVLLLPRCLREWLPEDHFVWFLLTAVEAMGVACSTRLAARMVMVARRMIRR
jgi:hypothetical protein